MSTALSTPPPLVPPPPSSLPSTMGTAAAASIDPARVLQLVVQLGERTQQLQAAHRDLEAQKALSAQLEREKRVMAEELAALRQDLDSLPAIIQRAEEYRAKWKKAKKIIEEAAVTAHHEKENAAAQMQSLESQNNELREAMRSSNVKWVDQLEAAEQVILELKRELSDLQQSRDTHLQTVVAKMHRRHQDEMRELEQRWETTLRRAAEGKESRGCQCSPLETSIGSSQTLEAVRHAVATQVEQEECELRAVNDTMGSSTSMFDHQQGRSARTTTRGCHHFDAGRYGSTSSPAAGSSALAQSMLLQPSMMQHALLHCGDRAMEQMIHDGEVLQRRQIEKQIKIHDRLLATVQSLQKEAIRTPVVPPLPF